MRILLTNDDGIGAPGIAVLRAALEPLGDVVTIAPMTNCSAVARSITIDRSLHVEPAAFGDGFSGWALDGTPCDCVRLALLGVVAPAPHAVVSGINLGGNMGDDVTYSGTVGAAFEGALHDLPAIAVSVENKEPRYLGEYVGVIGGIVARALADGLPPRTVLNVNLPDRPVADVAGVKVAGLGGAGCADRLELAAGDAAVREFRVFCDPPPRAPWLDTDAEAVAAGYIAVTPLRFDLVDPRALKVIDSWALGDLLPAGRAGAAGR
jgi:5'-nucleotidase